MTFTDAIPSTRRSLIDLVALLKESNPCSDLLQQVSRPLVGVVRHTHAPDERGWLYSSVKWHCGGCFPACCMDYDHRPGSPKVAAIGTLVLNASWSEVETEIAKCDLVCANCHRIRTQNRRRTARGNIGEALRKGDASQRSIADFYGVSEALVSKLKRAAQGVSPRRQLSTEQHQQIRDMFDAGNCSQRDIARRFGISQSMVSRLLSGNRGKNRKAA